MPGFIVSGVGAGAPTEALRPYYKYTWVITNLFGDAINLSENRPLIYARDAMLPRWSFEMVEGKGGSVTYKYAGRIKWEDVRIDFYDTTGMAKILQDWRSRIWTPAVGIKPANDYKKESVIKSAAYDFLDNVEWRLINSWPSAVNTGELSYTESDIKRVTVTITYDWAVDLQESGQFSFPNVQAESAGSS